MSVALEREDASPPPPTIQGPQSNGNTIRIMLATDNHIGYNERDPIRGQDSINTFKEILQLAVKHDVDLILLAGDLFHENRPSRDCLYRTIALLREYTLGDKPVQIELLSDPEEGKADGFSFPAVNYEDPNFNIGIPVFSIHGNHDDPQGAGPQGALSALDILSVSGLVNYMGKFDLPITDAENSSAGISIHPVLLRKGHTHLGLYGVGNVKDARMHHELRNNRVRMFMPRDREDWFNILLLHQNRVKHGPQESVPEGMFDDSIDLVIWGHEHDCRILPEPVAGKQYFISQPGSSVATSLADGESIEKHVALLQIQGKEFQLTPIPLRTVRPFVLEDVILSEAAEDEGFELTDQLAILKFLKKKVNALIEQANTLWDERNKAADEGEEEVESMLPLIRLKVDTTGVAEMSNPIRFGQEFQGRVANPRDMLVFNRQKKITARRGGVPVDQPELSIDDPELSISEKLAKVRVGTLVKEYLQAQELQLLGEGGMSEAIQTFVDKDDPHAIETHVATSLRSLVKTVRPTEELGEEELEEMLTKAKEQQEKGRAEKAKQAKTERAKGKEKATANDSDAASIDSMLMEVDAAGSDFEEPHSDHPPPKKRAAAPSKSTAASAKKAPARAKGKKAIASDNDDDFDEYQSAHDEEVPPATRKRTNRAAVLSQPAKKAPAKKKAPTTAKQAQLSFTPAGRSSTRAAASKAKSKMVEIVDDSD